MRTKSEMLLSWGTLDAVKQASLKQWHIAAASLNVEPEVLSEGNTLSDYSEEEIKRQSSVNLAVIPVEWNNCKINLVDVPGIF